MITLFVNREVGHCGYGYPSKYINKTKIKIAKAIGTGLTSVFKGFPGEVQSAQIRIYDKPLKRNWLKLLNKIRTKKVNINNMNVEILGLIGSELDGVKILSAHYDKIKFKELIKYMNGELSIQDENSFIHRFSEAMSAIRMK